MAIKILGGGNKIKVKDSLRRAMYNAEKRGDWKALSKLQRVQARMIRGERARPIGVVDATDPIIKVRLGDGYDAEVLDN